jgi:dienelactone hydrolase
VNPAPSTDSYYRDLGRFSDWVEFARRQASTTGSTRATGLTPARVRECLGFPNDHLPVDASVERTWQRDGVAGEEISWSVGYGPKTRAWFLRPAGVPGALPGVVALHDHGGFKFYGKEKIADGPGPVDPVLVDLRRQYYGDRAFANELARAGFAVLVPDVFLWGSRRFDYDEIFPEGEDPDEDRRAETISGYNQAAATHEHVVAKYCTLLGTSLAGVVAYEDRVALEYLRSRPDVVSERVACIGLSGGGCRAALMQATAPEISVAVIVGMMSTYDQLLDRNVAGHTWMFFPPGLAITGDWPDLAACRAPSPLVVQYRRDDHLFSLKGMVDADERIAATYSSAGAPENYVGEFYDGGHSFDRAMQDAAFAHLARWCAR